VARFRMIPLVVSLRTNRLVVSLSNHARGIIEASFDRLRMSGN
jgi:hypothetical protein